MNTVSITSKTNIELDELRSKLERHWQLANGGPDRVVIEESIGRVYIYHPQSDSVKKEPNQLYLDYSSVDLVKKIIEVIADDPELTVENDFGTALPGDKFVSRIRTDRGWDWHS